MSGIFDVSKLTPLPDNIKRALRPKKQTLTEISFPVRNVEKSVNGEPNTLVLPPLTILPNNNIELITLPDIPQTSDPLQVTPSQPTMSYANIQSTFPITGQSDNQQIMNQYMNELQVAPLSPRSPRVRPTNVSIVSHPVHKTVTESCCICYDEEISTTNLLNCKHPVCEECISQLQKPECPMCKSFLSGPLVTDNMLADIMNRQEQARLNEMSANYLAGMYLEEHPEANAEDVYSMYGR